MARIPVLITESSVPAKDRKSKIRKAAMADEISISVRSLENMMAQRIVPFYKIGGIYLFDLDEVNEALRRFRVGAVGE